MLKKPTLLNKEQNGRARLLLLKQPVYVSFLFLISVIFLLLVKTTKAWISGLILYFISFNIINFVQLCNEGVDQNIFEYAPVFFVDSLPCRVVTFSTYS
jgi:hypothetical protein